MSRIPLETLALLGLIFYGILYAIYRVIHRGDRFSLRTLLMAVTALAVVFGYFAHVLRDNRVEKLFGRSANVAIVAQPTRVEAFRIGPLPEHIYWDDASPADYPVVGGPIGLPRSIAADASSALLSPNTYLWNTTKSCIPNYGVKLSFIRDSGRVDVLLCFECDVLWISRDGSAVGGEDFDNSRAVLVRVAKAAFPGDEVIQKLEEVRQYR